MIMTLMIGAVSEYCQKCNTGNVWTPLPIAGSYHHKLFWTFYLTTIKILENFWVQSFARLENAQGLCFRKLPLKASLQLLIVFAYCFLSFSEHCLAYKPALLSGFLFSSFVFYSFNITRPRERSQAAHMRLDFCENLSHGKINMVLQKQNTTRKVRGLLQTTLNNRNFLDHGLEGRRMHSCGCFNLGATWHQLRGDWDNNIMKMLSICPPMLLVAVWKIRVAYAPTCSMQCNHWTEPFGQFQSKKIK